MCPQHTWDLKLQFWGLPLIIPGHTVISSSICVQKCSSGLFSEKLSQCYFFYLESSEISSDPRCLAKFPEAQEFQNPLPFLSKVLLDLLCLQAGTESGQCPSISEEGQRPALFLLKPKEIHILPTSSLPQSQSHGCYQQDLLFSEILN